MSDVLTEMANQIVINFFNKHCIYDMYTGITFVLRDLPINGIIVPLDDKK